GQAGRIDLNVVPSTRPIASPAADKVIAPRGKTTVVDVLANDEATNPFPGKPLRVIGVRGLGSGNVPAGVVITPSADKSTLSVTVAADAEPADTTLQYEVADATGDPDRYAWGTVAISVQDRPAPVSNVQVLNFADRSLTFSWIPGAFNNSPITGFDVTVTRSATGQLVSTTTCTTTTCAIPTPGNGPDNAVTVAVSARNALGLSDPTPYAESVWSDVIPAAPSGVSAQPLDHGLRFTWTKPATVPGSSPITSDLVSVGGVTSSLSVARGDAVGTAYSLNVTDAGIANGASIGYAISSRNDFYAGRTTWNQTQGSGVPAGPPQQTGTAPVATPSMTDGTTATLSWPGVFSDNGASISRYFAGYYEGGVAPTCTVTGVESGSPQLQVGSGLTGTDGSSMSFSNLSANHNYSFIVYAYNGQGCTPSAVVSATPRRAPAMATGATDSGQLVANGTGIWDFNLENLAYAAGSG
ncbi:fibronectin type III domain-containing protein, partial [Kitasatospora herbaricolor]|uniref:fibronectin type III domain-containing protein n=1 Tax=Kitasatospora herbaricolor TaxID=68217 RepID=UPI0036DE7CB6